MGIPGYGVLRHSRNHLQQHHEVRCRYSKRSVRQHRSLWWHHHVSWNCGSDAKGDHGLGACYNEDQDHRAAREEIFRLDRRIHSSFTLDLPADVDFEARIRRKRPFHRPPEVLLKWLECHCLTNYLLVYKFLDSRREADLFLLISLASLASFC